MQTRKKALRQRRNISVYKASIPSKELTSCFELTDKPKVAYLTMAWDDLNTQHAVINCREDGYDDELKYNILLHQPNRRGIFAKHKEYILPITVVQIDVPYQWPAAFLFKLIAGLEWAVKNGIEITAIWDEDDRYTHDYILQALLALQKTGKPVAWTHNDLIVTAQGIKPHVYRSCYGTIVGKSTVLLEIAKVVLSRFPEGRRSPSGGALDAVYRKVLLATIGENNIASHGGTVYQGKRYYFIGKKSNATLYCRCRHMDDIIDLADASIKIPEQKARFQKRSEFRK